MELDLNGLNDKEVLDRKNNGQLNDFIKSNNMTVGQIILSNIFTYFNFIFLVIAIIICIVHEYSSLTFLPLIITNLLIGIIQEVKSKKTLDKLTLLHEPKALVIRNGVEEKVLINELVKDDLVIFGAGNQIMCDAIVVAGEALVNESLLTGEPDEIKKEINSNLLSGSYIVSGKVVARLTHVGADSYINKLTLEAKSNKKREDSEMIKSLNKILKVIGILIIPIGLALFSVARFKNHDTFGDAVSTMAGSILMMIPEGLYLLTSVSLAISSYRLAKKDVLLHNMKSIETLARVNVLCIDKTGTITDNHMVVNDYEPLEKDLSKEELYQKICNFSFAQDFDNITMEALKKYFNKIPSEKFISKSAFSSSYKYSGVNFKDYSYIVGAPDLIMGSKYEKYKEKILSYSVKGYRVLAICEYDKESTGDRLDGNIKPFGIIILSNPIRENAAKTFKYFESQGVEIKVISGDAPETVSNIAIEAGIKDADKFIETSKLSDEELKEVASKYVVFGRVSPHAKQVLVKALKDAGNKVAMTGDGVNDVLALKEADCSIAMASGADAAMQTSQVVLLDSDFSKMPDIVYEGRRVVNNLERSGAFFLTKNIFALLFSIVCIITGQTFPITAVKAGLINLFTIGAPAFLLSQISNKDIIKGRFTTNILKKALPAGLTDAVMVGLMVLIGNLRGLTWDEISVCSTLIMAVVGFMVVIRLSIPYTLYKTIVSILCLGGLVGNILLAFLVPFLKDNFYKFTNLSKEAWVLYGILSVSSIIMYLLIEFILKKIGNKHNILDKMFV